MGVKPLGLLVFLGNVDCCCCCSSPRPSNSVLPPFVNDHRKNPQSEVADYLPLDGYPCTLMTLPYSILISKWRCFRSSDEVKAIHSPVQQESLLPSLRIDTREIIISATSLVLNYVSASHRASQRRNQHPRYLHRNRKEWGGVDGRGAGINLSQWFR